MGLKGKLKSFVPLSDSLVAVDIFKYVDVKFKDVGRLKK